MGNTNTSGLKHLMNSTRYSMQGLKSAWKNETAFRQELIIGVILVVIALIINFTLIERLLLIGSIFIVFITELLNSAIEAVVDRVGTERHILSGQAKDLASAAVFISLLMTAIVWISICYHHFSSLVKA